MTTLEGDRPDLSAPGNADALAADWHEALNRYHRTTCALDRALSHDHGITVSDFEVLQSLHAADDLVKMQDLAEQVHLTQSALSRLITRLERAGLVTRGTCQDDRRAVWTQITAAGTQRYLAARPTQRAVLADIAAGGTGADCRLEPDQG